MARRKSEDGPSTCNPTAPKGYFRATLAGLSVAICKNRQVCQIILQLFPFTSLPRNGPSLHHGA